MARKKVRKIEKTGYKVVAWGCGQVLLVDADGEYSIWSPMTDDDEKELEIDGVEYGLDCEFETVRDEGAK